MREYSAAEHEHLAEAILAGDPDGLQFAAVQAFSTQLRGVRQISPGNVVKPTGIETGVGAWPAAQCLASHSR